MKNVYTDNYKILMKEIEEDINKWKDILYSQIVRINVKIVKNVHITQCNLQILYNTYQNLNKIFHRNKAYNPKICMEPQNPK